MLKESKELNKLDKLHRERTRWVTTTWVFGTLFAISVVAVVTLGISAFKQGTLKGAKTATEEPPKEAQEEAEPEKQEIAEAVKAVADATVDDDAMKGSPDAPVTIIEFSDFLCPFCAVSAGFRDDLATQMKTRDETWEAAVPKILENYLESGDVRFVFRDCPFHSGGSVRASEATECARDQDKYWEMHDLLFLRQEDFPEEEAAINDFLASLAEELELEPEAFKTCLEEGKYTAEVQHDLEEAKAAGVTGTPTYFINGHKLVGAQGFAAFAEIIEEELNK